MSARPTFEQATSRYVHRFTMEHVPAWAKARREDGTFYAPQYRTDREWYENTTFPGEPGHIGDKRHCYTSNQSWPLGQSLKAAYVKGVQS